MPTHAPQTSPSMPAKNCALAYALVAGGDADATHTTLDARPVVALYAHGAGVHDPLMAYVYWMVSASPEHVALDRHVADAE